MKRLGEATDSPPHPSDADTVSLDSAMKRLRPSDLVTLPDESVAVPTKRMEETMARMAVACDTGIPVLVEGDAGVGKTTLVKCFAALRKHEDVVVLNMGEQTDAKAIVGLYAADEKRPGFFRWVPGLLAEALRRSSWLLIEDAHLASVEMLSILLPVIESRKLFVHTTGETIVAKEGFRIFATKSGNGACPFENVLGAHWYRVGLEAPREDELLEIVKSKYGNVACPELLLKLHLQAKEMPELSKLPLIRLLFRLCDRTEASHELIRSSALGMDEESRRFILLEAYDVYGAALPKMTARQNVARMLSQVLYVLPEESALSLVFDRYPEVSFGSESVQIGRVVLPRRQFASKKEGLAPTKLSRQVLERLTVCISSNTPVLLVGETGTGKTTLVQELAKLTGHGKLSVLNMSQQTETADLLGGFRPLSAKALARSLFDAFQSVFKRMVEASKNETYFQDVVNSLQKENWTRFTKLIRLVAQALVKKVGPSDDLTDLLARVDAFEQQSRFMRENVLFGFVEGALVEAVQRGHWILLDEINLASSETLEVLSALLASPSGSIHLSERGDAKPIQRHPDFRLFACMNPATDVSKRDLPASLRHKFTEVYVDETDVYPEDLKLFIKHSIPGNAPVGVEAIASLYYRFKEAIAKFEFVDGSNHKPLLNLRTLSRALRFAQRAQGLYGFQRALYEGFCLAFTTLLGPECRDKALSMLSEGLDLSVLKPLKAQATEAVRFYEKHTIIDGYVLEMGSYSVGDVSRFVLTPSVKRNVAHLARALMAGGAPILLEGPTSSGKTSVVEYLALSTGHRFMRINNHEHTDLQEYLGAYQPDAATGQLVFREGLLVEALRQGYWLVLDELNLAPSDVLEALNRLLDDNRELYVPELHETIKPHPEFRLFATQNPAGSYGGRKSLSRAFRSRFLELQVDDLPVGEVEQIIAQRCQIAPSYAKKIGQVYRVLQEKRQATANLFAGRHALVTLRDLFRWAMRPHDNIDQLAENGYAVLAERIRHEDEASFVKRTIEATLGAKIDLEKLYDVQRLAKERNWTLDFSLLSSLNVTWTKAMKRTFSLALQCILAGEPVLLVGETGCGKTTVCQLISELLPRALTALNCHQNTETSDILGCLRPSRIPGSLFTWYDGPLVQAMREGSMILLDEISLAEDAVLERLNSVLEPHGTLVLAEYIGDGGGYEKQVIKPAAGFAILATMNPGGDYGKKELSPALRNRFTEIWVPSIGDWDDVRLIVSGESSQLVADRMVSFLIWWKDLIERIPFLSRWPVSLRDILSWSRFTSTFSEVMNADLAFIHAAIMLFVDPALSRAQREDAEKVVEQYKEACLLKLLHICGLEHQAEGIKSQLEAKQPSSIGDRFGVDPFFLPVNDKSVEGSEHTMTAPTTLNCVYRVLRAMQLGSAVLIEGSPGVGKTTLIESIARLTGHRLVRINLSDQTDLMDLFGTDLPVEGGALGQFHWCDGPFLRALKAGDWILLDELNLASQSVLEGLNACLDHRGSVYIPELNMSFAVSRDTRIFAAQNPLRQGGGRKGLPKSFVNRFITVWFDALTPQDYQIICKQAFPDLPESLIDGAIEFNRKLGAMLESGFAARGRPWEFNLRDLFRWLKLSRAHPETDGAVFARSIYIERFRTAADRAEAAKVFEEIFGLTYADLLIPYHLASEHLHVGTANMQVKALPKQALLMRSQLGALESTMHCLYHAWLAILVGASGAGKTSLVRLLAELAAVPLIEFFLGPDTDTLELLGSFEQTDYERKYNGLALKYGLKRNELQSSVDEQLHSEMEAIRAQEAASNGAQFEWVDGPLTKALTHGHWILLENANMCSPAVLDRLNSLFEPNGCIHLNESSGKEVRVIRPHPEFRIFMTVDPQHGELSRAMRNRGVEIAMIGQPGAFDRYDLALSLGSTDASLVQETDLRDCVRNLRIAKNSLPSDHDNDMVYRASDTFFRLGSMYSFENLKAMLGSIGESNDPLNFIPVILTFLAWSTPDDFQAKLALLKDLSLDIYDKVKNIECPTGLPDYSLDLTLSSPFRSALSTSMFGSSQLEDVICAVSPLTRPIYVYTPEEARWKELWEASYSSFGFRDELALNLLSRKDLSPDELRLVLLYNLQGCSTDITKMEAIAVTPRDDVMQVSTTSSLLESNLAKLKSLQQIFTAEYTSPSLEVLQSMLPSSIASLWSMEKLTREYYPLIELSRSIAQQTLLYSDNMKIGERADALRLVCEQKTLLLEVLETELAMNKIEFISTAIKVSYLFINTYINLSKMKPAETPELIADLVDFANNFVDPSSAYYEPLEELTMKQLTWLGKDEKFQQFFQNFYFGYHQNDSAQIIDAVECDHQRYKYMIRSRADGMNMERIKKILSGLGDFSNRENLLSAFERLRGSGLIPSDLAIGPLLMLGQIVCNMIQAEPAPLHQSLLLRQGKWVHRSVPQLMIAFACFKVAKLFGRNVSADELIMRLADRLSNVPSSRSALDEEDATRLFEASELTKMNQHVAESLMDTERQGSSEDLEDLAELYARNGLPVSPRACALVLSKLARPHKCASKYNHICPDMLEDVLACTKAFVSRVNDILVAYPEHDLLQSLQKRSQRLLETPVAEASLFGVSAQIENILAKVQTWQSICSKSDTLASEADALMDTLFVLRKAEMESWVNLREHIVLSHGSAALGLWGWLTKLLASTFKSGSDLLALLDTFLLGCPTGEFEGRIRLLQHVLSYDFVPEANRVIAWNCSRYYAQFLPGLFAYLNSSCEPLLHELKGFLATIRWNDKNIVAHVECSRKVHIQVIKSYKALQELYQMPMSVTISKLKLQKEAKLEDARVDSTLPSFDVLTAQMFDRLAELKALTSKDSIKMKQNAVVELFRLLKHIGIKLHRQFDAEDSSLQAILLALPLVPASDGYLFKSLLCWNEIHGLLNSPHVDNVLRQMEIFKTSILQLILLISQFYNNLGDESAADEDSNWTRVVKILSMTRALIQEASILSGRPCDDILRRIDDALTARSSTEVWLELATDLQEPLFEQADLTPINAAIVKNYKRLRVLLSNCEPAVTCSEEPAKLPLDVKASEDLGDFGFPADALQFLLSAAPSLARNVIEEHGRQLSKFTYVLSMIFAELLRNGFCRPVEEEEAQQEAGDSMEISDGVGMAKGSGEKDVGKEIEFEEQITDLVGEDQSEEPAPPKDAEGLDMENDFEAQLEDLVDEPDQDESQGDGGEEDEKPQPKDEVGEHDGMDYQDQMDMDIDQQQKQDMNDLSEVDQDLDLQKQDGVKEFGEQGEALENDLSASDMELDGPEDLIEEMGSDVDSDADLDVDSGAEPEPEEDKQPADDMDVDPEQTDDENVLEQDHQVLSDEDLPEEDESEPMIDVSKGEKSADQQEKLEQKDSRESQQAAHSEGEEDGTESNGQQELPKESAACESKADEPAQQNVANPLDELLENMFKSVHSIMEEDRFREKQPQQSTDFSQQQQFEHSTDIDNTIGLVAPVQQDTTERLREKVELTEQQDTSGANEEEEVLDHDAQPIAGKSSSAVANVKKDEDVVMEEPIRKTEYNWDRIEADVSHLASELCEQLRLVLEPTKATKLKGDYKTGKRLNLRKLIPYIISQYRKDKIWLRRTKPSKRMHRVALSVDNSRSMKDSACDELALRSVSLVSQALSKLEAGQLAVFGFGEHAEEVVGFDEPTVSGSKLLETLRFNSDDTNVAHLMSTMIESCEKHPTQSDEFPWNLNIIISDGICENHEAIRVKLNEALEKRIMNIFVILDPRSEKDSITELSKVQYVPVLDANGASTGKTAVKMQKYLETFPFENYIVVKNVEELPTILSESIKQWFELLILLE